MNQSQYNQLFSFIWNIATDVLVYAFEKGEYNRTHLLDKDGMNYIITRNYKIQESWQR